MKIKPISVILLKIIESAKLYNMKFFKTIGLNTPL